MTKDQRTREDKFKNSPVQNFPYPHASTKNKNKYSKFVYILKIFQKRTVFYKAMEQLPSYLKCIRENRKEEIRYIKEP